jgi:hypothetical protein
MPSGGKELVINGLERAVSSDINRLQRFANADRAELLRILANTLVGVDDLQAGAGNTVNTTSTSPASADVWGGLVVRPIVGTATCSVDPGVIGIVAPDSTDPDSSAYKYVVDPGVSGPNVVTLAPNTSGQTRIDVIGATYNLNANAETDNRDIFVPSTGAFAATSVPKATQGQLVYSVLQGTPGAGFASVTIPTGFVPLAVASIPTGFANISTSNVTFWDVRPYVGDRLYPPFNISSLVPHKPKNNLQVDTTGGLAMLTGDCDTSATDPGVLTGTATAGTYRLGGIFANSNPLGFFNLNLSGNQSGSVTAGVGYVYLLEPFGLPRWALYQAQSGVLVPANPRGIVTVSNTAPSGPIGSPSAPLVLPTATGLLGSTSKAVCVACVATGTGSVFACNTDGRRQYSGKKAIFGTKSFTTVSTSNKAAFVPGTDYPPGATALYLTVTVAQTIGAGSIGAFQIANHVQDNSGNEICVLGDTVNASSANPTGSGQVVFYSYTLRVAVPPNETSFTLFLDSTGSTATFTTQAVVNAWEFGF